MGVYVRGQAGQELTRILFGVRRRSYRMRHHCLVQSLCVRQSGEGSKSKWEGEEGGDVLGEVGGRFEGLYMSRKMKLKRE
jgi:hypothetical protein